MKKYLVIGNPIEHSLSPKLHNYWLKENKIDAVYERRMLTENDIEKIILKLRSDELHGVNVTVPFKNEVVKYMDILTK